LFRQTQREKSGTIDGLNLFFGALLGANLGTLDALPLEEYFKLVILLAGTVMALRIVSVSERRIYALATLLGYGMLVAGLLVLPNLTPRGMATADLHRLVLTLSVWIVSILLFEFFPVKTDVAHSQPGQA
jgi:hypothetical protein